MRIDGYWNFEARVSAKKTASGRSGGQSKRKSPLWNIWVVLTLTLLLLACSPTSPGGNRGPKQGGEVLRTTLDNGLRVVIVHNSLAPVVTTVVNYLVGSNEAPPGFPGTAHAQEHMMFRGSPGLSANQLADITAAMGGMFDADTQQTVTQYFFAVPAGDLDAALHIEAIRMGGVLDSEKLWQEERGAIEQEVAQDLSSPEYIFYTKLLATMFRGTVYAHDALGTKSSFDQTTGALLKKFYDTWYAPNNAILVIVGDVKPQETLAEVKKLFDHIPARKLPPRNQVHLEPVKPESFELKTDLPVGLAVISFRTPGYENTDYAAVQVLADVLSSERGKLYALVPEGKALFAEFDLDALPKAGIGQAIAGFPKGADAEQLVKKVQAILTEVATKGIPADLVEAAKRRRVAEVEFQKNSVFGLAMAWSKALAVEGRQSPQENVRAIESVSVKEVNQVARKYLDLDHAVVAILRPGPTAKAISSKGFGGTESFVPKKTREVKLPEWAEKALRRLSIPASMVHPVVTTLPNGIKLIVQPEDVSNSVNVYGHIENNPDLQTGEGQEGVDQVLDQLFSYGTTSLDRLAFQKGLDSIAANVSAGTDFSLEVLADHFDRGLSLLADNELHPRLQEKDFTTVQQQVAATTAGRLQSPGYLVDRAVKMGLFPKGDPTQRQATAATVSSLTLQDVKDYYQKVFRPDLTTMVVIGRVTPEKAKAVIENYFGGWEAVGPKPDTLLPPVPSNKSSTTAVPDPSRVQDKVTLAETLGLTRSNPDYYALELGNHVLGGGFYATRLYQDLREKRGLVYYVSSSFHVGRTRAIYEVNYGCDPPNVSTARAIIHGDLKDMQSSLVPDEQLRQAKAMLLREIPLSESSIESIAEGLLSRVKLKLPLDEPILAAHRYVELTAEQVRAAFAKWVRPADLIQVTQGPSPK
jgi:zinc protease